MTHGRKYGEEDSHPIPLWNGVFEHYDRIRDALWEFAWCIDRITEEREGVGIVLGGSPIKLRAVVDALKGSRKETVRRHMDALENENYIRRRRTPYGHVIEVLNSRKFGIWKKEKPQNDVSLGGEKPIYGSEKPTGGPKKPKNSTYKEDSAETQQEDSEVRAACPVWKETGVDPLRLPGPFRKHCEEHWRVRDGAASLFDFMGTVLDAWNALGNAKYPPVWVRRKAEIGRSAPAKQGPEPPELESIPWQK
jgi:hypothetical protein